jgi:branched-chain amino acid transport system permease protein
MVPIGDFIMLTVLFMGLRAAMAIGFSLIFGVSKVFYLTYGALYMVGAYMTYSAVSILNLEPFVALLMAVTIPVLIALISYKYLVHPRRNEELNVVILTFAFASVLEQIVRLSLSPQARTLPPFFQGSISLIAISISNQRLSAVVISFAALVGLWFLTNKTKIGHGIRAVSENEELARISGIDTPRIMMLVTALGAFFAGLSGFLLAPLFPIEPHMGWSALTEALTIVVLGGAGSIPGTIIGAFVVSFVEVLVGVTVSSAAARVGTAVVLIAVLLFKPKGLLGVKM